MVVVAYLCLLRAARSTRLCGAFTLAPRANRRGGECDVVGAHGRVREMLSMVVSKSKSMGMKKKEMKETPEMCQGMNGGQRAQSGWDARDLDWSEHSIKCLVVLWHVALGSHALVRAHHALWHTLRRSLAVSQSPTAPSKSPRTTTARRRLRRVTSNL